MEEMTKNVMLENALQLASFGLAVFPVKERGKSPMFDGWQQNCTTDPEAVKTIWSRHPEYNIGIATGQQSGGLLVVDVDNHDNDGASSLKAWEHEHGALPETATVITGSGGAHYYYKSTKPVKGRVNVLPGVDIRADGNLVVAPPSIHPSGGRYEWDAIDDIDEVGIAEADDTVMLLVGGDQKSEHKKEHFRLPDKITSGKRNDILFSYASQLQSHGNSDDEIYTLVEKANRERCTAPLDDEELDKLIKQALKYEKGPAKPHLNFEMRQTKNGEVVRQCANNVALAMREDPYLKGMVGLNEMSHSPQYCRQLDWHREGDLNGEWSDIDDSHLRAYLDSTYGLTSEKAYEDGFNMIINENSFHPIRGWLDALPEWDHKPHIENLLPHYVGAPKTEYNTAVLRLFMLGAVSRIYEPGCKFDYVLVLIGHQGRGKSMFLQMLSHYDEWYDGNFNTIEGDKGAERLRGKWIVEMAELLAVKRQKDVEAFKAFVTVQQDTYRPPYGRRTEDRKRMCVFAATTNDHNFMTDLTGNRRYLPIDVDGNEPVERMLADVNKTRAEFSRAWAEAVWIYRHEHPPLVIDSSMRAVVEEEQERYLEEDPWIGIIQEYLDHHSDRVCASKLWDEALEQDGKDAKRSDIKRINEIMRFKIHGWKSVGRQRCGKYGNQYSYELDPDALVEVPEDQEVPF